MDVDVKAKNKFVDVYTVQLLIFSAYFIKVKYAFYLKLNIIITTILQKWNEIIT